MIEKLIEYKRVKKHPFPFSFVKDLSKEEIIRRISYCIDNNVYYDHKLFKCDEFSVFDESKYKLIIPYVKESMDLIGYDYNEKIEEVKSIMKKRTKGKKFSFNDHLRCLTMSLLNNHRWGDKNVKDNIKIIEDIFHNFDKEYLKNVNPEIIMNRLKDIHCSNTSIYSQLKSMSYNISVLEKIEKEYGSLDNYILNNDYISVVCSLSRGNYKLINIGEANILDYLRLVGVDSCKSTKQLRRLFGSLRLGIVGSEYASAGQVISIIKKLSCMSQLNEFETELILQQFSLTTASNICGETPNCNNCKLKEFCKYNKN